MILFRAPQKLGPALVIAGESLNASSSGSRSHPSGGGGRIFKN